MREVEYVLEEYNNEKLVFVWKGYDVGVMYTMYILMSTFSTINTYVLARCVDGIPISTIRSTPL